MDAFPLRYFPELAVWAMDSGASEGEVTALLRRVVEYGWRAGKQGVSIDSAMTDTRLVVNADPN